MNDKQFALENFVHYLIKSTPDEKYKHRHKICEAVQKFGKEAVLEELEKQGKDIQNMPETTIMIRTIKDIDDENLNP